MASQQLKNRILSELDSLISRAKTQIKNEGKTKFIENRLIAFNAKKWHKGNAPKKGIRITLAFKCDRMKLYGKDNTLLEI